VDEGIKMKMLSIVIIGVMLILGSFASVLLATEWVSWYVIVPTTTSFYHPEILIATNFLRIVGWVCLFLGSFSIFLGIIGMFIKEFIKN
jgi:hypothetical protein